MVNEISEWGKFNEIYVTYFPGPKPARSAFGADGLALVRLLSLSAGHLGD